MTLGLFPQGTSSAQPMLCDIQTNSFGDRKGMVRPHSVSLHEAAGGGGGQNEVYGGRLVHSDNGQAPPHLCSAIFRRIAAEIERAWSHPTLSASTRLPGAGEARTRCTEDAWSISTMDKPPPHLCAAIFGRIAAEIEGARSDPNLSASARLQGAGRPEQVVWWTLGPSLR